MTVRRSESVQRSAPRPARATDPAPMLIRARRARRGGHVVAGVARGVWRRARTPPPARRDRAPGGGGSGLFFENWPSYIDPTEDGVPGTVDRFIAETGIDMRYTEALNDNNEYFAKIQPILGRGEAIDPDIIAPTGWLVARLIALGWLEELPLDQIPNAANLQPNLQGAGWDPDGKYSLPWQSGFAGIAYNIDVTGRDLTSVDDLFDPEFAGKVGALTEMRDTIGLIAHEPRASTSRPWRRSTRRRPRSRSSSRPRPTARSAASTATTTSTT